MGGEEPHRALDSVTGGGQGEGDTCDERTE